MNPHRKHWTQEEYDAYMQKFSAGTPVQDADMEQDEGDGGEKEDSVRAMAFPVRVEVHHVRAGTFDLENLYSKSLVDGIISTGLLPDDRFGVVNRFEASGERANDSNN